MHKTSKISVQRNNQSGNMLILICVVMALVAVGIVISMSFAGVFFAHNRLQTSADEIALAGARKLNEYNRLGQMNDMIARCRQLVYGNNQQLAIVRSYGNAPLLEKLTSQLNSESGQSASLLEEERHKLVLIAKAEATKVMEDKFHEIESRYAMVLPWMTVEAPKVVLNQTGTIIGMQSNSQELQGFDELSTKDQVNVFEGKPVRLYRAERDAKLPIPDSPSFRFSPLAAPVANEISPARVVLPESFKSIDGDYAPCATKIELMLTVATGIGASGKGGLKAQSAATATGGGLWQ